MPLVKFQADDKLADRVAQFTGHRVASKAFADAAERALRLDADLRFAQAEIAELKQQVASYQQTLASARDAALQLAEVASQGDMFQGKETIPSRLKHHLVAESVPKPRPAERRPAPIDDSAGTIQPNPGESMVDFVNRLSAHKKAQAELDS